MTRKTIIICFLVLFVPNVLAWALLYPGYFQPDHQNAIAAMAAGNPTEWHSVLWALLAFPFLYLLPNYACYGLFQILLFCACVLFGVARLANVGFLKHPIAFCAFMAVFPTFLLYNLLYSSDMCFAYVMFALVCLLIELTLKQDQPRSYWLWLVFFTVIACMLRKNALVVPVFVVVAALLAHVQVRRVAASMALALCVSFAGNSLLAVAAGASASPSQEFLAVPCAQVAACVANGEVPDSVMKQLETVKSKEEWASGYNPYTADGMKLGVSLSAEFASSVFQLGTAHPGTFLRAWWMLERPFIVPGYKYLVDESIPECGTGIDFAQHDEFTLAGNDLPLAGGVFSADSLRQPYLDQFGVQHSGMWQIPQKLYVAVNDRNIPVIKQVVNFILFDRALPFWVLAIGLGAAIYARKGKDFLLVAAPIIAIELSFLLFAPVALFRYSVQLYYALPLIVLFFVKAVQQKRAAGRSN